MIRCVMFDFGQVLMPFTIQKFYDFARAHQPLGAIEPERFFGFTCVARFDLDELIDEEFCHEMKRHLQLKVSDDEFWLQYCDVMKPDSKMVVLKRILKENGFKLAMVSNINRRHFGYAQSKYPEVFSDFDYLALSFDLGVIKPNLKMYNVPARHLGVKPEECFLIDDMKTNIDAFKRWGGVGYHYDVVDDKYCPNGRREIERNWLLLRMVNLGILTINQAGGIARMNFSGSE